MEIAIISSSKDPAGVNIRNSLIKHYNFQNANEKFDGNDVFELNIYDKKIKLYLTNDELTHSENIDKRIDADILVFASKHRSKENTKSFAVHSIGNWHGAELGGKEKQLCPSSAVLMKNIFIELNNAAKDSGYEITMEATHHGPYTETPSVFVEIGSTEAEWKNEENGKIIADTIMNGLKNKNDNYKIAVGIGGPHYCSNFNKAALRTDVAFSFICPKFHLDKLDRNIIKQAMEKTIEKIDFAVLDWKGLGQEKQRIMNLLKELNIECKRTDKL
ncbi:MAG TPA: D-aminoacyl-tRNA deacylase [Candidatus Nanoarchaeia archaeon]|nr:D-aminoacyl-tRNA deacylase [Candidatus Nanoarchaeia archaeon]